MTSASLAVLKSAKTQAEALTTLPVKTGVQKDLPYWRLEVPFEPESGRDKNGSATDVTLFASVFSRSLIEVYNEMKVMADGLTITPEGFDVLSVEKRVRQIGGDEGADDTIYGRQLEVTLTVEVNNG